MLKFGGAVARLRGRGRVLGTGACSWGALKGSVASGWPRGVQKKSISSKQLDENKPNCKIDKT